MIVNVAIPDIQQQFSADESDMQWVVAAYSLTMAMFIMSGAVFGDHYGRRLGYIVGIVVFCLASVGCGLSPNLPSARRLGACSPSTSDGAASFCSTR